MRGSFQGKREFLFLFKIYTGLADEEIADHNFTG